MAQENIAQQTKTRVLNKVVDVDEKPVNHYKFERAMRPAAASPMSSFLYAKIAP